MDKIELTLPEFAKISKIPQSTLYSWRKAGYLPQFASDGRIALTDLLPKVLERMATPAQSDQLREARIQETQQRARKLELQNLEAEGQLVRADDVVQTWTRAIALTKAKFLALASELAPELDGVSDTAYRKELIENAILDCLEELGNGNFGKSAETDCEA